MAWFLCPYKRLAHPTRVVRYCAMDDFTAQIRADGGDWSESEILGNHAIVKVRASSATLQAIAKTEGFTRLPKDLLAQPLSDLTNVQKIAIRDKIESLGYPRAEWQEKLGTDLGSKTLADVLRFLATRRKKPRYDRQTDAIILDGPDQPCRSIESVEAAVS